MHVQHQVEQQAGQADEGHALVHLQLHDLPRGVSGTSQPEVAEHDPQGGAEYIECAQALGIEEVRHPQAPQFAWFSGVVSLWRHTACRSPAGLMTEVRAK
ncbi:hypothetical protein D3C80_1523340 [compost metagenome]